MCLCLHRAGSEMASMYHLSNGVIWNDVKDLYPNKLLFGIPAKVN